MVAKIIPEHLERSTYVLPASLCLLLLMWQWQPLGGIIWSVEDKILAGLKKSSDGPTLAFDFTIEPTELFGFSVAPTLP